MENHEKIAVLRNDIKVLESEIQELQEREDQAKKNPDNLYDAMLYEQQIKSRRETIEAKQQNINSLLRANQTSLF